ncbi:MAG: flagellar protein FliT [Pseudomonadales bacterium]|jgi:Spy/CpxP family protein refolding chaperone
MIDTPVNRHSELTMADELIDIRRGMRTAFHQGRWQDLADLDKHCRSLVKRIIDASDEHLFEMLRETLAFYRELLSEFNEQKGSISAEVLQLRRAQSRNQVYRQMSVVR